MSRPLFASLAVALLATGASAHGGTYRGPGAGVGPGAGPAGPATGGGGGAPAGPSTSGGDGGGDLVAWQLWWSFNRDAYLALRAALAAPSPLVTGSAPNSPLAGARPTDEQVRAVVAPALLAAVAEDKSPDVATAALLALAKVGVRTDRSARKDASAAITKRLADANQEISETAATALGILARPEDSRTLAALLADDEAGRKLVGRSEVPYRTRAFAAFALGIEGSTLLNPEVRRYAVHQLARTLETDKSSSRDVQVACASALGLVPLESVDAARTDDGAIPAATSLEAEIELLERFWSDAARPDLVRAYVPVPLARLASRAKPALRAHVVGLFTRVLEPGANEPPAVRQSAVIALGLLVDGDDEPLDRRARALLRGAAEGGDRLARRFAWISLARAGARPGKDGADALSETRPLLIGGVVRGSTVERPWASLALGVEEREAIDAGRKPSTDVASVLAEALRTRTSPTEAGAHAIALALSGAPDAGRVLLDRLLEARDDEVRAHCAIALGLARETQAIDPLRKLVLESRYKPRLIREAAIALGLLGDRSISPALVAMLREAQGLSAQSSIATALGWVGDARAVDPLVAMAADRGIDAGVRAFACVALGLLCDPAPLPWNSVYARDANWWLPTSTLYDPVSGNGVLDLL